MCLYRGRSKNPYELLSPETAVSFGVVDGNGARRASRRHKPLHNAVTILGLFIVDRETAVKTTARRAYVSSFVSGTKRRPPPPNGFWSTLHVITPPRSLSSIPASECTGRRYTFLK